ANAAQRILFRLRIFHEADEIPGAGEPASQHPGFARTIDHVVDAPWLEATVQSHAGVIDKAPFLTGNANRRVERPVSDSHEMISARGILDGIRLMPTVRQRS